MLYSWMKNVNFFDIVFRQKIENALRLYIGDLVSAGIADVKFPPECENLALDKISVVSVLIAHGKFIAYGKYFLLYI